MTSKIYKQNRQNLVEKLPQAEYIIVAGNGQMARSRDTAYRFRQDSNLLYLTGISIPNINLLIDVKKGVEYLIYPSKSKIEIIFEGQPNWQKIALAAGIEQAIEETELKTIIGKSSNIFMNIPNRANDFGVANNPGRGNMYKKLKKLTGSKPKDARQAIAELRVIKQPYEIKNIQKAVQITNNAIEHSLTIINSKITEKQIENDISANFALNNVEHAYLPIVASGPNAATLHYEASNNILHNNAALLFDVGAEYNGYSADISQSFVIGKNTKLESLLHDLKQVQKEVIKQIKPGLMWRSIHDESVEMVAEIIHKNKVGNKKDVKTFYPQAIGHFVGLDTHDVGDYRESLKEGMVLSVEPGIVKTGEFGLRVEDEIIVTKTGAKIIK